MRLPSWLIAVLAALLLLAGAQAGEATTQEPAPPRSEAQTLIDLIGTHAAPRQPAAAEVPSGGADAAPAPEAAPAAPAPAAVPPADAPAAAPPDGAAAPQPAAQEPAAQPAPAEPEAPPPAPLIGDRIVDGILALTRSVADAVQQDFGALRATVRRLGGLAGIDPAAAGHIALHTGLLLVLAGGLVMLAGPQRERWIRRLGQRADGAGMGRRLLLGVAAVALDVGLILGLAVATATIFGAVGQRGADEHLWTLFVGAYLVAGLLAAAVRTILRPSAPPFRVLPMEDASARHWARHLSIIIALVTFAEIFARPLVTELASPITAQATVAAINAVAALYLMGLVWYNRRAPVRFVEQRAADQPHSVGLAFASALVPRWHWIALVLLAFLFHQALTSGEAELPTLVAAAQVALAIAVGLIAVALLSELADRGLSLSPSLNRSLPTMEARLNGFLQPFLRLLRWVVLLLWLAYVLQIVGSLQLWQWAETRLGIDLLGITTSLVTIVLVGFTVWLVLASWIDYRLAPGDGRIPTAREQTLLSLLRNASLIAILIFGLMTALSEVGVSVTPLLASAGVIGLAISFGSQKLVQDIITGVFIQFENAINVGDVVEVGGKIGTVEKLTIRSVSLRDVEGVVHMVPFSSVDLVSNHMKGYSYHIADIAIAHGTDLDRAKAAMLAAYDDLTEDPLYRLKLVGGVEWFGVNLLGETSIVLRARIKTRPGEQWAVGRAYAELVNRRFEASGIHSPVPQLKLWLEGSDDGARGRFAPRRGPRPERADPRGPTRQTIRADEPTDADRQEEEDADGRTIGR